MSEEFSAVFNSVSGTIIMLLFVGTIITNLWSIILTSFALDTDDECKDKLKIYFIGSIIANLIGILAYGLGFGSIYILSWAIYGHILIDKVKLKCLNALYNLHALRFSVITHWYSVGAFIGILILMTVSKILDRM